MATTTTTTWTIRKREKRNMAASSWWVVYSFSLISFSPYSLWCPQFLSCSFFFFFYFYFYFIFPTVQVGSHGSHRLLLKIKYQIYLYSKRARVSLSSVDGTDVSTTVSTSFLLRKCYYYYFYYYFPYFYVLADITTSLVHPKQSHNCGGRI